MAFLGGDSEKVKIVLTKFGQETLANKGLEKQIRYYTLYDPEVNYQVNVPPSLMMDISGNKKTIIPNSITFRDNFQNG